MLLRFDPEATTVHKTLLAVFIAGAVLVPAVHAQHWGHESFPREGVCFFKDPNFKGEYFCAGVGDSMGRVPDDMNDRISSIRVFGRSEVTVFRDQRFGGNSARFRGNINDLKGEGWDDRISSFRVLPSQSGGGEDPDRIIRRAYQDVLHREPDEGGYRQYRSRIQKDGWTEEDVRNSLRSSPEYRELSTMTPAKAKDIVRRAYLSVLKREPDPGADGFVNRVLNEHWSQEDVERELRRSPEYRNRQR
jgi:hypothetical protein